MSPHVVVVGAGIAGFAAALAAHAGGARVSVSAGPAGASELAGGAWDLRVGRGLGLPSDGVRGALRRLSTERPSHPLGRLPMGDALGDLEASHRAVLGALGTHRSPGFDAAPERVATAVGLAREAMLAQHAVLDLAGVAEGCIAVASLPGLRSFDARFVAASLTEQAVEEGRGQRFVALDVEMFRRAGDGLLLPHEAAEVLDADEGLERFAVALKRALGGASLDGVLVPPILGLHGDGRARRRLEARLGLVVGEVVEPLAGTQSVRMSRALGRGLETRGIARWPRAVSLVPDARGLVLDDGRREAFDALVLATGKFLGGGLHSRASEVQEALVRLPLGEGRAFVPAGSILPPTAGFEGPFLGPRPGFARGVRTDLSLRPIDASGRVVDPRLFACGALLDGVGPADGLAVAAATGHRAGVLAARAASGASRSAE